MAKCEVFSPLILTRFLTEYAVFCIITIQILISFHMWKKRSNQLWRMLMHPSIELSARSCLNHVLTQTYRARNQC